MYEVLDAIHLELIFVFLSLDFQMPTDSQRKLLSRDPFSLLYILHTMYIVYETRRIVAFLYILVLLPVLKT